MLNSIEGLEHAKIMRDAYAIEYDCINSLQLLPTLEYKNVKGLFTAGQINGTSGYEEAGAQGLIAGINASLYIRNKPQLVLKRSDAYIGVLIDDLVTKGTHEPYRMMTSRAEYRLHLRQDNADIRLTEIGRQVGLVDDKRYKVFKTKMKNIEKAKQELKITLSPTKELNEYLTSIGEREVNCGVSVENLLKRPKVDIFELKNRFNLFSKYHNDVLNQVQLQVKYDGYIKKQLMEIEEAKKLEDFTIPTNIDYNSILGLRLEARQKLSEIKPLNLGQASRISGVSPADISVLTIYIKSKIKS